MHLPKSNYQLLDFGLGRKLERIGNFIVERPCPGAVFPNQGSVYWLQTHLSYDANGPGRWNYHSSWKHSQADASKDWECNVDGLRLHLKPTLAGQIGIFPEHWAHWPWLMERIHSNTFSCFERTRVLSLFAYTGATTMALARAGCEVTHVDASKPTVAWAKENCNLSVLNAMPIRWIVDDANAFVKRELRREKRYDLIILDPPTYGHGVQGARWEIRRDLPQLLQDCWQLLSEERLGVLLCGHSSHIRIRDLNNQLIQSYGRSNVGECEVTQAFLTDAVGRKLDCGFAARYSMR